MKQGKCFHRCIDCATEWYDNSARRPNYCPECASQREAARVLASKAGASKSKETRHLNVLMHKYGRRLKLSHDR